MRPTGASGRALLYAENAAAAGETGDCGTAGRTSVSVPGGRLPGPGRRLSCQHGFCLAGAGFGIADAVLGLVSVRPDVCFAAAIYRREREPAVRPAAAGPAGRFFMPLRQAAAASSGKAP